LLAPANTIQNEHVFRLGDKVHVAGYDDLDGEILFYHGDALVTVRIDAHDDVPSMDVHVTLNDIARIEGS